MNCKPVVLCGGSGTRLWPLSRTQYPKQLINFGSGYSLLQETARRISFANQQPVEYICNERYRFLVAEQLRSVSTGEYSILLEPIGRNTAPAIAVSAFRALEDDPVLLVLPSDAHISDQVGFEEAVGNAIRLAMDGRLVTFGVPASAPETGYGYIRKGKELGPGHEIESFVEKPDVETARKFVATGDYAWNAGMFAFRASVFLSELEKFEPELYAACRSAAVATHTDLDFIRLQEDCFSRCKSISVDYAVMERTSMGAMVSLDAGWTDLGSFASLWEMSEKDDNNNVVVGDVYQEDAHNNLIRSENRLITVLGVSDTVVVETTDAVLVADRERSQDIKVVADKLKSAGRSQVEQHRQVYRPWGSYESIATGDRFQVKLIEVRAEASLSLQLHHHRAEHWIVVSGTAKVTRGEEVFMLSENESTYIPVGTKHRLENPGKIPLRIIEVQSGSYLGEDDIVRFEDKYGRDT